LTPEFKRGRLGSSLVKAGFHIPSLDGLRTVSFAIVFCSHAGLSWIVPGAFGVTVFFFLSGFLITTLLRLEQQKNGHVSMRKFYLRRVLRILPPFYLVLAGAVLAAALHWTPVTPDPLAVLAQAAHYANYWIVAHGFDGFPAGTGVYWSLAVEEHFYLLFPWIFLLLVHTNVAPRWQAGVLLALCALTFAWRVYLVHTFHPDADRTAVASDTRVDSLLFGCALALYENPSLDGTALTERLWKRVLFPLGVAGLLVSFVVRNEFFRETIRYTLQGVSLVPVFVCAVRYPTWWPIRPLNTRPMAFLGVLSYSLYLIHQVVLAILEHGMPALPLFPRAIVAFAVTLGLSFSVYHLVEKPCARLRKRLSV
jgi:peptidoglycan/LPS O-acetylase OafA/YrhL